MKNVFIAVLVLFSSQIAFAQKRKPIIEAGGGQTWTGLPEEKGAYYTVINANIALWQKGNFNLITGIGFRGTRLCFEELIVNNQEYDYTEWNIFVNSPLKAQLYLPLTGNMQGLFTEGGLDFYYLLYRRENLADLVYHKTGKELYNAFIPAVTLATGYDFSKSRENFPVKLTLTYAYEVKAQKGRNNFKNLGLSIGIIF